MGQLAVANYDPAVAVTKATSSLLAMTAVDTTNLRLTFTVPANGSVLVRLRVTQVGGSATNPQIFLGVLEGSTLRGRVAPVNGLKNTAIRTTDQVTCEALYVVTGLTPGASLTWDAAYGVDIVATSTTLNYGGPNNNSGNNAFGGFVFEIYDAPNLLVGINYDPTGGAVVTKATTALLAMTAFDTTNLRGTFTVPPSGKVLTRVRAMNNGANTNFVGLLGVLQSATVVMRQSPIGGIMSTAGTGSRIAMEASAVVTGLTPGASLTWDAAYAVQVVGSAGQAISYGGPNDTTTNNAGGALGFEVWAL